MRLSSKIFTLLNCTVLLAGCSGASLIDNLNPGASADIGEVEFLVIQSLSDGSELTADVDGSKTLVNDLGFSVKLAEAKVNWKTLKLVSGGADPECEAGLDQNLEINSSQDFLGEDLLSHVLAEHEIPKIPYCGYELTLAPGIAAATLKNHEGEDHGAGNSAFEESFHLAGTWSKEAASGDFHIHSTDSLLIASAFHSMHDAELVEHPLHFHEGDDAKQVLIKTHYDTLLNGIDFQNQTEEQQRAQVIANFPDAVGQHFGEAAAH